MIQLQKLWQERDNDLEREIGDFDFISLQEFIEQINTPDWLLVGVEGIRDSLGISLERVKNINNILNKADERMNMPGREKPAQRSSDEYEKVYERLFLGRLPGLISALTALQTRLQIEFDTQAEIIENPFISDYAIDEIRCDLEKGFEAAGLGVIGDTPEDIGIEGKNDEITAEIDKHLDTILDENGMFRGYQVPEQLKTIPEEYRLVVAISLAATQIIDATKELQKIWARFPDGRTH